LFTFLFTYLRFYLLTYLLTYVLIYFLIYLLTFLFTFLFTYLRTYLLSYLLTYVLIYFLIYLLTFLFTFLFTYLRTYLLPYLLTYFSNCTLRHVTFLKSMRSFKFYSAESEHFCTYCTFFHKLISSLYPHRLHWSNSPRPYKRCLKRRKTLRGGGCKYAVQTEPEQFST